MSKIMVRVFSVIVLLAILCVQVGLTPVAAAFPGANGKIAVAKAGDIWLVNTSGAGWFNATQQNVQNMADPSWSPDGSRIAFICQNHIAVCLMDADGANKQTVVSGGTGILSVDWHPSGSKLLYVKSGELWRIHDDQTNNTQLTFSGGNIKSGSYSPDGTHIVYADDQGIKKANSDGLAAISLTVSTNDEAPNWSPDGERIVFGRGAEGARTIFIMDKNGGNLTAITASGTFHEAAWSPDGKYILFTSNLGLWMIDWSVDPTGSNPMLVTGDLVRAPSWQPINVFDVNSSGDDPDVTPGDGLCETAIPGECTLRAAINEANYLNVLEPITIQLNSNVTLTANLPAFSNSSAYQVIIKGNEYQVDGTGVYSLISVASGMNVTVENTMLVNGHSNYGGAIYNEGTVLLKNSVVLNNVANYGGGIYNETGASIYVLSSLLKGNTAVGYGGAIKNVGTAVMVNTTITENNASSGAGFANLGAGNTFLYHVTMVANHSSSNDTGGFAGLDTSTASLFNTIIAGNTASFLGQDVGVYGPAAIAISSHNLFGESGLTTAQSIAGFTPSPSDVLATSDGTKPTGISGILNPTLSPNPNNIAQSYKLVPGSPAIDAADFAVCTGNPVSGMDQGERTRAKGNSHCDIGADETEQVIFTVTNISDSGADSLRQAITDINGIALNATDYEIHFDIANAPFTISLASALPAINRPVFIDGSNNGDPITLDGTGAGTGVTGLILASSKNMIQNLTVTKFDGSGIAVLGNNTGNVITKNSIYNNKMIDLDLNNDGLTLNHDGFFAGPNNYQNYPIIDVAAAEAGTLRLIGTLESDSNKSFTLDVYTGDACHSSFFGGGETYLGAFTVTTNASGLAVFDHTLDVGVLEPEGVSVTATDTATINGNGTSEFSYCHPVSTSNLNWTDAHLVLSGLTTQQYITDIYQEKWFKFPVPPGARVSVKLTGQPGSAISLHSDPRPFYDELINPTDETSISAESSDTAFRPSGALPSRSARSGALASGSQNYGFLPSRSARSGALPAGSQLSGSLPYGALPSRSARSGALPSGSLPSGSLPYGALPSRSARSGALPSRSARSGALPSGSLNNGTMAAYNAAALQSLIAISMNPGVSIQTIEQDTYDYLGDMYVRVVAPYDLENSFSLEFTLEGGVCTGIQAVPNGLSVMTGTAPAPGTYRTLILTDTGRMVGTPTEISAALTKLQTLAVRAEVNGLVLNLVDAKYERVNWANTQADQHETCPAAKNIVAEEIKGVIDLYRATNSASLQYIVLAGGGGVIPYFQVQDEAEIANEKEYIVPVAPQTPSEAGLESNLMQGQDAYGSSQDFSQAGYTLPFPDLAVGRLVDTASDITTAVNAYISMGGIIYPATSLVTGYDFVADGAQAIQAELQAGIGTAPDTLIQVPNGAAWTATNLRNKLVTGNYDVIALSGHYSAGDLLAADYTTQLSALNIAQSTANLQGALVLTLGCHSGYTIPNGDLLTGASPSPDWAKAILRKGAAGYIASTGYAYGGVDSTEYGERLFTLITQQLRTGTGPVSVGQALMEAKRKYLADTTQLSGIDHKTMIEISLYGLPMMRVNMPGARLAAKHKNSAPIVGSIVPVVTGPGANFELSSSQVIAVSPSVTQHTLQLDNLSNSSQITTTYYSGEDGVVSNPFEPIYPKETYSVDVAGTVLRGVAFRGGTYTDLAGIIPLTTAPATEISTAHTSFHSDVFYPTQTWMPNYSDTRRGGDTQLMVFPVQYRSTSPISMDGTLRIFSELNLQFFYLPDSWSNVNTRTAAISAAPNVLGALATEDGGDVVFDASVSADGDAGVQAVWILYTGKVGSPYYGSWQPLDLVQDVDDPDLWSARLTLDNGANIDDLLFMVQAVGGAGLTTLDTNDGAFYGVDSEIAPLPAVATTLTLISPPTSGIYSKDSTFYLNLMAGTTPVENGVVSVEIGGQEALAITDASGNASVTITVLAPPDSYVAQASFVGDDSYLSSTDSSPFTVNKDTVTLGITPSSAAEIATPFVATIQDSSSNPLPGKFLVFVIHNTTNTFVRAVKSNFEGEAPLGGIPSLPAGTYTVDVYFGGTIPVGAGNTLTKQDDYYQTTSLIGAGTLTTTLPTAIITAKKANNTAYTAGTWSNQTVTVHFACNDSGGSGIASCPADQVFSAEGTFTATGTVTDNAGYSVNVSFGPIKIDKTAPKLAPKVTPNPVLLKKVAIASAGATDTASGIASQSCTATNTITVGTKTVTCTATDRAGNKTTAQASYLVIFDFAGFYKPVNNQPTINQMKAGQAVQVNFSLRGNRGLSIFAAGYPVSAKVACGTGPIANVATVSATASSLKFNALNNIYTYVWKTSPSWANTCRLFTIKLTDGRVYKLNFKFLP